MSPALFDQTVVDVEADEYGFRATGTVMRFPGFTRVYDEGKEEDAAGKGRPRLPELNEGERARRASSLDPKQHFTEPPPRYTEAALVKALEDNGIGRPSTYSTIVETIQARGYVTQQERRFMPTEIGTAVNDLLVEHFPNIVNLDFTARMEGDLDKVADGHEDWVAIAAPLLRTVRERARSGGTEASAPGDSRRADRRDLPQLRPPDGDQERALRQVHFVHGLSGVQDDQADRQGDRRRLSQVRRHDRRAPIEEGPRRSTAARNYPNCDFISWDRRHSGALPGLRFARGAEDAPRQRRTLECAADREHDVSALAASAPAEESTAAASS